MGPGPQAGMQDMPRPAVVRGAAGEGRQERPRGASWSRARHNRRPAQLPPPLHMPHEATNILQLALM